MAKAVFKTPQEMEIIRKADAIIQEKRIKSYVPEAPVYEDKACFIVSRCVSGPQGWVGFFRVDQLLTEDSKGRELKKPIRKTIKDGVDFFIAITAIDTALRKKIFR